MYDEINSRLLLHMSWKIAWSIRLTALDISPTRGMTRSHRDGKGSQIWDPWYLAQNVVLGRMLIPGREAVLRTALIIDTSIPIGVW